MREHKRQTRKMQLRSACGRNDELLALSLRDSGNASAVNRRRKRIKNRERGGVNSLLYVTFYVFLFIDVINENFRNTSRRQRGVIERRFFVILRVHARARRSALRFYRRNFTFFSDKELSSRRVTLPYVRVKWENRNECMEKMRWMRMARRV